MYCYGLQTCDLTPVFYGKSNLEATTWDWINLLKPRVVLLVAFTGLAGLLLAPGHLSPLSSSAALLAIVIGAGSAGAINMWFDRDIDGVMRRTSKRPIPYGKISASDALAFGIILAFGSVILMLLVTNIIASGFLAISIIFYVVIYTMWLKRRTPQNIVIGGAAGAFPPLIGWLAVTGTLSSLPLLMSSIIFFWTPPHFWALSLYASVDYREAAVPMLPIVRGKQITRLHILLYTVVLVLVSAAPWTFGKTGLLYGISAVLLGSAFIVFSYKVYLDQDHEGNSLLNDLFARKTFAFSLTYLFLLFFMLIVDSIVSPASPYFK